MGDALDTNARAICWMVCVPVAATPVSSSSSTIVRAESGSSGTGPVTSLNELMATSFPSSFTEKSLLFSP